MSQMNRASRAQSMPTGVAPQQATYRLLLQAHSLFWMATALIFGALTLLAPTNQYGPFEAALAGAFAASLGCVVSLCMGFPAAMTRSPAALALRLTLVLLGWFGGYTFIGWRTQGPAFLNGSTLLFLLFLMWILLSLFGAMALLSQSAMRVHGEALRAERAIADARAQRLARLRSQLAPHFICNALNAIAERMDQNPEAAQRMTADLADLIRDALQDLGDEGTIEREVERVTNYLAVEKSRFEAQLELTLAVSPGVLSEPCPPLLLLPLLENAVRHGSRSTAQPLWVRLQIEPGSAGEVRISVSNPGALLTGRRDAPGGLGLENVKRRLAELYPGRHDFTLEARGGVVYAALSLRRPV